MGKKKKILTAVIVIVVAAAVVIAVAAALAFRTQPILKENQDYECAVLHLWLEGGNNDYQGRKAQMLNDAQNQSVLDILSRYDKKLSSQRLGDGLLLRLFPSKGVGMTADVPDWVEAGIVVCWQKNPATQELFNVVLGNGHVQIRYDGSYYPPYYNIVGDEQTLYEELSAALGLPDLLTQARGALGYDT
jgi:hypothetical protein